MATKITDLTELTTTPGNDDVLHIVDISDTTGGSAGTSKKIKVSTLPSGGGGGSGTVTSVALAVPSALSVAGSPVTTAGTITISGAGTSSQYIDGTGGLQTTPTGTVTAVTGVAPITSTGGNTPAIAITDATPSARGAMSASDKSKLDGIAAGAEVNVNADWNATSGDAQILNKPTIPAAGIAAVVDDPSPQLGGNLDVQTREIDTSTSNGNIIVAPNGTGVLEVKGDTNDGAIQLNCNQNSHGVKIQSPPHSAAASYTLVLPDDTGTNGQVLTTDGSGNLSFTTVSGGGGGVTSVTGTAPIVSSGGNTPAISINTATTSVKGAMSAADKVLLNTIAGAFVSDDAGGAKNVAFESLGGISASAGVIVSMLQDTTADNTNANSKDFLGVVTSTSDTCVINGLVEITGQIPNGATAGRPLWLGTSGTFISAAPTATNAYARVVGHYVGAISAGSYGVFFNPSNDWIQIS